MKSLACGGNVVLIATFALAAGASAQQKEGQVDASDFARPGIYVGVGGTYGLPQRWDSDFDNDLNEKATERANEAATDNLDAIDDTKTIVPLDIVVDGADLEDGLFGVNGLVGYRLNELVAFEAEAEWLVDSNKSNLDVNGSTGSHTAKVEDIWTITANVKVYPFTERFQPFAVFGLGLQHSKLDVDVVTSGVTTTDQQTGLIVVPADFRIQSTKTKLDGAIRLGGGIDIYATRNIVAALTVTYVTPFSKVGELTTDYTSIGWRILYRF